MRWMRRTAIALGLLGAGLATAGSAGAADDACREWWREHQQWKAAVVGRQLLDAGPRALDEAVFELLQREAWLTSCERSARLGRERLVGWTLIGRLPEDYAAAVVESVLAQGGLDLSLHGVLGDVGPGPAPLAGVGSGPGRGVAGSPFGAPR